MNQFSRKWSLPIALLLLAGCKTPPPKPPDTAIVLTTLQSYHPRKTTFTDFKKDAGLITVERPVAMGSPGQPGGDGPPVIFGLHHRQTESVYGTPLGSPWRIYGTEENVSLINGTYIRTEKFVVGDINHPIAALTFDANGKLKSIAPVP